MPNSRPSAAVRRLLDGTLDSFEKLELALALHRAPARTLSVPELSKQLQLPRDIVERGVDELCRVGVVHVAGGLARLAIPADDPTALEELAALYDEDRLLVVRTLTDIAMNKIRGMAARTFADAFQLRRKKEDGDG